MQRVGHQLVIGSLGYWMDKIDVRHGGVALRVKSSRSVGQPLAHARGSIFALCNFQHEEGVYLRDYMQRPSLQFGRRKRHVVHCMEARNSGPGEGWSTLPFKYVEYSSKAMKQISFSLQQQIHPSLCLTRCISSHYPPLYFHWLQEPQTLFSQTMMAGQKSISGPFTTPSLPPATLLSWVPLLKTSREQVCEDPTTFLIKQCWWRMNRFVRRASNAAHTALRV